MPKYNIYKIKDGNREALQRKLSTVGLIAKNEKQIGDYTAKFYFSDKPDLVKIWWVDLYKDFIDVNELPNNELYFGILLLVNKEICYAISFGKAHFYLREYCDGEFGLNLAERIVDENNLRIKTPNCLEEGDLKILSLIKTGARLNMIVENHSNI